MFTEFTPLAGDRNFADDHAIMGGLARLGVTRTMINMYMVPLFAIAIAVVFLGEHMTMARWIGAAAVLCGIAVTRRAAS